MHISPYAQPWHDMVTRLLNTKQMATRQMEWKETWKTVYLYCRLLVLGENRKVNFTCGLRWNIGSFYIAVVRHTNLT
jgi:hypothetical protein